MLPLLRVAARRALANPGSTATGIATVLCLFCTHLDHEKVLGVAVFILGLLSVDPQKPDAPEDK